MSDKRSKDDSAPGSGRSSAGSGGSKRQRKAPAPKRRTTAESAADKATKAPARAKAAKTPKSTPAARESPRDEQPAKESKPLPAFGLAEDILADRNVETAGEGVDAADPERIFSFADGLEEAAEKAAPEAPTRITTWVTFHLAGEVFAMPVEPVREVLRVASITRVPHAPSPIRGVTNVRGRVIPVIDLRLRIGLAAADLDRASRVVVVRSRGRLLGLLVDSVHQVAHLDLNKAQPPPEDVMTVQSDYISGVYHLGEQLVLMLDVDRALVVRDGPAAWPGGEAAAGKSPSAAGARGEVP